jgi:large subunit ribosomal protein L22
VLKSAVSNAEANHGLIGDELLVSAAYIDEGPTIKRWRARARGRVARIRKRTCHITLKLAENPAAVERAEAVAARRPKKVAAAPAKQSEPKPRARAAKKDEGAAATATTTEEKPKRARAPRRKKTEEAES